MTTLITFAAHRIDEDGDLFVTDADLESLTIEERNWLLDNNMKREYRLRDITVEEEAELARLIAATEDRIEAGLL